MGYSTFLEPRRDPIRLANNPFSESERIAEGFADIADGDRWFDTAMMDNFRNMRSLIMDTEEMLMEGGPEEELINEWRDAVYYVKENYFQFGGQGLFLWYGGTHQGWSC